MLKLRLIHVLEVFVSLINAVDKQMEPVDLGVYILYNRILS